MGDEKDITAKRGLFVPGPAHGTAVLNFGGSSRQKFGIYGQAFHEAGRALLDRLVASHSYSDWDALPILFNYRHAVELHLKAVVLCGREVQELEGRPLAPSSATPFRQHKLVLWIPEIKRVFKDAGWKWRLDTEGVRTWGEMEALVRELEATDEQSDTFRYPVNSDGGDALPLNFRVYLPTFCARLDALLDALSGAETGLSVMVDTLQDMASDAQDMVGDAYDAY